MAAAPQVMVNCSPIGAFRSVRERLLVEASKEKPVMVCPFSLACVGVPWTPRTVTVFSGGTPLPKPWRNSSACKQEVLGTSMH